MNCKRCNNALSGDAKFCGKCAEPVVVDTQVVVERVKAKTASVGIKIMGIVVALFVLGVFGKILMVIFGVIGSLVLSLFGVHGTDNVETAKDLGNILGLVFGVVLADKTYRRIIGRKEEKNLSKPKKWYQFKGIA